jgi:hypothetical protein
MNNYPSVTQVLSIYQDFSNIPPATLDYATERGVAVHKACAAIALGLWTPGLRLEWQAYVNSFARWFDQMVSEVVLVETRLTDRHFGYTGTPDFIFKIKNNVHLSVVDLKTPTARYKTWAGQLAAYLRLAQANEYDAHDALTLQPDPKGGSARAYYLEYKSDALAAFLGALQGYKYFAKE